MLNSDIKVDVKYIGHLKDKETKRVWFNFTIRDSQADVFNEFRALTSKDDNFLIIEKHITTIETVYEENTGCLECR